MATMEGRVQDAAGQQVRALLHCLDALEWAARTLDRDPARLADVARVCECARGEALDMLVSDPPVRPGRFRREGS